MPGRSRDESLDDLMLRLARGDDQAVSQWYDLSCPRVFGIVVAVIGNSAQAEEVTQEALVEIWRTASRFDPNSGSAIPWVCRIAHRRAIDHVRAEQGRTTRERRIAAYAPTQADHQPDEQAVDQLQREQVHRCLGSLTELQRESLQLAYYAGYTYREVAAFLGIHPATVKTRIRDGLTRLRDQLESRTNSARR